MRVMEACFPMIIAYMFAESVLFKIAFLIGCIVFAIGLIRLLMLIRAKAVIWPKLDKDVKSFLWDSYIWIMAGTVCIVGGEPDNAWWFIGLGLIIGAVSVISNHLQPRKSK